MRKSLQVAGTVAAGAAIVVGTATLLVLARHSTSLLVGGVILVAAGSIAVVAIPLGRTRVSMVSIVVLVAATVTLWGVARSRSIGGPEPIAPVRQPDDGAEPLDSAQALERGVEMARASLLSIDAYGDYTCTFTKRERARNLLGKEWLTDVTMALKVRHEPFSAYIRFERPESNLGAEVIYVDGQNEGKLIAHSVGVRGRLLGVMRLEPTSWQAMINHRYPITRIGMRNVLVQFLEFVEAHGTQLDDCDVQIRDGESLGRACRCLEIRNAAPKEGFPLAQARICFDARLNLPVQLERWEFAEVDGEIQEQLVERYVYADIELDCGLSDLDFDPANPEYEYGS